MDNGLIFPYRYKTAHGELVILTARIVLERAPCGYDVYEERRT